MDAAGRKGPTIIKLPARDDEPELIGRHADAQSSRLDGGDGVASTHLEDDCPTDERPHEDLHRRTGERGTGGTIAGYGEFRARARKTRRAKSPVIQPPKAIMIERINPAQTSFFFYFFRSNQRTSNNLRDGGGTNGGRLHSSHDGTLPSLVRHRVISPVGME